MAGADGASSSTGVVEDERATGPTTEPTTGATTGPTGGSDDGPGDAVPDLRRRRREQTRREILDAAWELAERDGIAGLSLRDLAAHVGMRAPSLYTYFANKAAIYDAMFAAGFGELDTALDAIEVDLDTPIDALAVAIESYLDFCSASMARYQLMFTRAVPDWEPSPEAYAVSVAGFERTLEKLAGLGIREPRAVDLFTAVTSGLASQQLANDPGGTRWRDLSRDAAAMLLEHLGTDSRRG